MGGKRLELQNTILAHLSQQQTPFYTTLCPDWLKIWGRTLFSSLLMDFIAVSQFAFLSSVFANCVFLFFPPFPLTVHAAKTEMTSCREEAGLNTYPQGPAGEPGTKGRRGVYSTGGWGIYRRGKSDVWKGHFWERETNVENICSVLTWWWGETEDTQMKREGFDEKGQSKEAINISR